MGEETFKTSSPSLCGIGIWFDPKRIHLHCWSSSLGKEKENIVLAY